MLIAAFACGFAIALALVLAFFAGVHVERKRQAAMSEFIAQAAEQADEKLTAALNAITQPQPAGRAAVN